jgi:hypothetical protein
MMTFLWWLSLVLVIYFGTGIAIGFIKRKMKVAGWAIIVFLISLVFCLTML